MTSRLPLRRSGLALCAVAAACMPSFHTTTNPPVERTCPGGTDRTAGIRRLFSVVDADNRAMDRWCHVLGPPVLDSLPEPRFGPWHPPDSLNVVSWNANAGAGDVVAMIEEELGLMCDGPSSTRARGSPHAVLLLQEALRRSADIPDGRRLGLVAPAADEASRPGPRLDVVQVSARCGLSLFYAPQVRNGFEPRDGLPEDRGVAILSTLPITGFFLVELPLESAPRVVVVASIGTPAGALRVASLHFITTPPPWRVLVTGNSSRVRQARAVLDALSRVDSLTGASPSTLVAGDFNTWSLQEGALRWMRRAFPDSPVPLAQPTRGPFPTDHIFYRRADASTEHPVPASYRRVASTYYSDHNPVTVRLAFAAR